MSMLKKIFYGDRDENKLKRFFLKRKKKDIDKWHHYFDIYDKYLKEFSYSPINMLEIGVSKGGSVKMWSEYFHEASKIYGMDISEETKVHNNFGNIEIIIGDQSDKEFLTKTLKHISKLDIVIDDGGHTAKQQINAFETIYPQIAENGVYIVEDTHTSYMKEFQDLGPEVTFIEYTKKLIDELHDWWRKGSSLPWNVLVEGYSVGSKFDSSTMDISNFCKTTQSIHVYDSMVIFKKGARSHPVRELR